MPSKITIEKSIRRALYAGIIGSISAFAMLPVNLEDPSKYFKALSIGMISGFIMGIQKFIKGYIQYDKK